VRDPYKAPVLNGFGGREFDGIKARLRKVMRKYLHLVIEDQWKSYVGSPVE